MTSGIKRYVCHRARGWSWAPSNRKFPNILKTFEIRTLCWFPWPPRTGSTQLSWHRLWSLSTTNKPYVSLFFRSCRFTWYIFSDPWVHITSWISRNRNNQFLDIFVCKIWRMWVIPTTTHGHVYFGRFYYRPDHNYILY